MVDYRIRMYGAGATGGSMLYPEPESVPVEYFTPESEPEPRYSLRAGQPTGKIEMGRNKTGLVGPSF